MFGNFYSSERISDSAFKQLKLIAEPFSPFSLSLAISVRALSVAAPRHGLSPLLCSSPWVAAFLLLAVGRCCFSPPPRESFLLLPSSSFLLLCSALCLAVVASLRVEFLVSATTLSGLKSLLLCFKPSTLSVEHATKIQRLVRYLGVINGNMKTFSILTVRGCLQYLNLLPAKVHNSSPPNIYHHRRKCKWLAGSTLKFWDLESFELIGSTKQEGHELLKKLAYVTDKFDRKSLEQLQDSAPQFLMILDSEKLSSLFHTFFYPLSHLSIYSMVEIIIVNF
ncbi:hypothetical protein AHAS_Ahas14G0029100 [Arachis hypogaea]